jgi:hypothetical protein
MRAICCGAGVSPAFLKRAEIGKIAGETPAPRKPAFFATSIFCVPAIGIVERNEA